MTSVKGFDRPSDICDFECRDRFQKVLRDFLGCVASASAQAALEQVHHSILSSEKPG